MAILALSSASDLRSFGAIGRRYVRAVISTTESHIVVQFKSTLSHQSILVLSSECVNYLRHNYVEHIGVAILW